MGINIETIQPGDNATFPKVGQKATCHYVLTLQDGRMVDSSRVRGTPFTFTVGRGEVIPGWDQGIAQFSVGQRAKLTITPDLAYGPTGIPNAIPPNAILTFDVELLSVN